MNLLKDDFISTTQGKVSLKTILTSEEDYQLQYYFDEIQLAMLQLLSSLTTVALQPTIKELKGYINNGVSPEQYEAALKKVESQWFEDDCFMQSKPPVNAKWAEAPITKLLSGIECGTSPNAIGLFSEVEKAAVACPDCIHGLNYNLHMNIKGECFGPTGATGIRGGGAISTLIAGENLKKTLLNNAIANDYFKDYAQLDHDADDTPMWVTPISGDIYQASKIGIHRGLFALAYHIGFNVEEKPCICDVCGSESQQSVKNFNREKYKGSYGSTKNGRDSGAGWWPHPYTPRTIKEEGVFAVCARDQNWHSWQELGSYIVGKETDKATVEPAYILKQFQYIKNPRQTNLLIGGNIADQGGITGRVYDLYSMPSSLDKHTNKVTQVIDSGLEQKDRLSQALNKMFGVGYDKNFVGGIKENAMQRFTANAQQIIQRTLLDVERKEATKLRQSAVIELQQEAKKIFLGVQRKYQHDLPLFKALVKGETALYKK
ncbi:MAG: type I-E CRISPR-associated protein Cse1/CasA [Psychromonas sp.]